MKCDNCSNEALYTVADPGVNPVNYCGTCLPVWLADRAAAGQLNIAKSEKPTAPAASSKKKAEAEAPADADN